MYNVLNITIIIKAIHQAESVYFIFPNMYEKLNILSIIPALILEGVAPIKIIYKKIKNKLIKIFDHLPKEFNKKIKNKKMIVICIPDIARI